MLDYVYDAQRVTVENSGERDPNRDKRGTWRFRRTWRNSSGRQSPCECSNIGRMTHNTCNFLN